jgi:hypothetical protein
MCMNRGDMFLSNARFLLAWHGQGPWGDGGSVACAPSRFSPSVAKIRPLIAAGLRFVAPFALCCLWVPFRAVVAVVLCAEGLRLFRTL